MESIINKVNQRPNKGKKTYEELRLAVLSDQEVQDFIQTQQLTEDEVTRSMSKFFEYITQRNRFVEQDADYSFKGYRPILIKNEGYADVSYEETAELVKAQLEAGINQRIQLLHLPKQLRQVSAQDLDFADPNRSKVYHFIKTFIERVADEERKGLYLYGSFGVGKTYIMAYLARELSEKCQLATILLHFPSFSVDIKNAINKGNVKDMIDQVKEAPVLVLDDIGAEQFSPWIRDDVLQVILQHRMQEGLPTFFTSNFSLEDLERHFANGRSGDETWQAKRLMERIRFLTEPMLLKGDNRR